MNILFVPLGRLSGVAVIDDRHAVVHLGPGTDGRLAEISPTCTKALYPGQQCPELVRLVDVHQVQPRCGDLESIALHFGEHCRSRDVAPGAVRWASGEVSKDIESIYESGVM